jgi:hypothetical protein
MSAALAHTLVRVGRVLEVAPEFEARLRAGTMDMWRLASVAHAITLETTDEARSAWAEPVETCSPGDLRKRAKLRVAQSQLEKFNLVEVSVFVNKIRIVGHDAKGKPVFVDAGGRALRLASQEGGAARGTGPPPRGPPGEGPESGSRRPPDVVRDRGPAYVASRPARTDRGGG